MKTRITPSKPVRSAGTGTRRRGITAVWLILSAPLLIALLGLVLNIGFLWLARSEVKNAAVSACLTGAQVWGPRRDTARNRRDAVRASRRFAAANSVKAGVRDPKNNGQPGRPRARRVLLGDLRGKTFISGVRRPARRACLVEVTAEVEGPFGWLTGPRVIRATAVAVYDEDRNAARLVHVKRVHHRNPSAD